MQYQIMNQVSIMSGHRYTNNDDGIQISDSDSFHPSDLADQSIGDYLTNSIVTNESDTDPVVSKKENRL